MNFYYLLATLGLTIMFSFAVEKFLKPFPTSLNKETNRSILLQSILVSFLFIAVSLVVQRLVFSSLAVSIFLIILSGVSNAKYQALREPLVFSDIAMFSQAFKHPRLYFPFLGLLPVVIMPLLIIGLISLLLILEPALEFTSQRVILSVFALCALFIGAKQIAKTFSLSEDPATDNQQYGLVNSLFSYAVQAQSAEHQSYIKQSLEKSPFIPKSKSDSSKQSNNTPPHFSANSSTQIPHNITVIQSESFFDARRMDKVIKPDVLEHYDACLSESIQYGKLDVPAWGANTMRSEFSFLTGLKYENMGLYRYYPYQYLHKLPVVSLAKLLQSQGYRCVCIHPHPASFFGRDRIFPQMGFDEFIDIKDFTNEDNDNKHKKDLHFGPYISDQAVSDKILEVTAEHTKTQEDKPLFIFAITMENHGPLHLEKTTKEEQASYLSDSSAPISSINSIKDLTVYLRHLKNADRMIQHLTSAYRQSDKPSTLCFYGDHIPSMPKTYQELDYNDKSSDYFIWGNQRNTKKETIKQDISVDNLAEILLTKTANLKTHD